jgi:hypothetical protein
MSKVQVLIAGELMSDRKANLVASVVHGSFLKLHYRLHHAMPADWPCEPTAEDLETYKDFIEMIYLFDPAYFTNRFKPKNLFTLADEKAILHFTLEECIAIYHANRAERIAAYRSLTASHYS